MRSYNIRQQVGLDDTFSNTLSFRYNPLTTDLSVLLDENRVQLKYFESDRSLF